ncbi:MAG TPA: FkbM family methyltransferase, partial [Marinagarivorans sp.]
MKRELKKYNKILGLGGVLKLLQSRLSRSNLTYRVELAECKHPFILRIPSSDVPTYQQVFIDREYQFKVSKQPKVIVDAGANIGLAAIYFANQYPNAKIIAIEPEKGNFDQLTANTKPYPNIT